MPSGKVPSIFLKHGGKTLSITQWSETLDIPRSTITDRLRAGRSTEEALATRSLTNTCDKNRELLKKVWQEMIKRCTNADSSAYKNYGGRGISICTEWTTSFDVFFNWCQANGYERGLLIDRRDNNGNYEPANCRWVNRKTQNNNKRNIIWYILEGDKMSRAEYSRKTGIPISTLRSRELRRKNEESCNSSNGGYSRGNPGNNPV